MKRSREGGMFHVKRKRVAFRSPAGACLLCRLLPLPLVCFSAPIPPTPFPRGEGGDFWFSYARGSAPCIPGAKPGRHWLNRGAGAPGTPAAKPARHWLFSAMSVRFPPSPRPPSPVGKGEIFVLFCRGLAPQAPLRLSPRGAGLPGGSAPCIPGAEPARHWFAGRLLPLHPRG